jgi:MFS transporter, DHA1 family, multidrug resistance protein
VIGGLLEFALGYRATFLITAGLLLTGGLLVTALVREHFVPPPERADRRPGIAGFLQGLGAVVRTPVVAPVFFVRFLAWTGRSMIIPFLPLLVAGLMAGANTAGLVTGLAIGASSAAGTVTSIVLGRLGDRVGHRTVALTCAGLTALAYVPLAFVASPLALVVLYAFTGATIGGVLPTLSALLARVTDKAVSGAVYGLDNSFGAAARGLSPIVGGGVVALSVGAGAARRRATTPRCSSPPGVLRARAGDAGMARALEC